jgi:starch synthase
MSRDRTISNQPGVDEVCISSLGQFHMFELAKQVAKRGALKRLYTGTPRFLVKSVAKKRVRTFPWLYTPLTVLKRYGIANATPRLDLLAMTSFDDWVSRSIEPCRIFHFLSSYAVRSHSEARRRFGAIAICDRGSSHIVYQDRILAEEFKRWGHPHTRIDPQVVARELEVYASADYVLVPSTFCERSFIEQGVSRSKIRRAAYGTDLSLFHPEPKQDDKFRVIYVGGLSFRKGIPYLLEAVAPFQRHVELELIGELFDEVRPFLAKYDGTFRYRGIKPRAELRKYYSQASVFVMASIEEGLALVMAQAMACGLPVIATENTGGSDLFTDGVEGFSVPIRSAQAIREKIEFFLDNRSETEKMGAAALERVRSLGGWDSYGDTISRFYREALEPAVRELSNAVN